MTDNQEYLNQARKLAEEFKTGLDTELLREAYMALENVDVAREPDSDERARMRSDTLASWLTLLHLLDSHLDPKFDPDDVPSMSVEPPETSDGTQYPPGADPALIDDPKARAEYEKAIAANSAKIKHYNLQTQLRRLNDRIPPRVERFIRASYTSAIDDRQELRTAFEKYVTDAKRKAGLWKILPTLPDPPQ